MKSGKRSGSIWGVWCDQISTACCKSLVLSLSLMSFCLFPFSQVIFMVVWVTDQFLTHHTWLAISPPMLLMEFEWCRLEGTLQVER